MTWAFPRFGELAVGRAASAWDEGEPGVRRPVDCPTAARDLQMKILRFLQSGSPWIHSAGAGTGKISPPLGQRTRLPTNSIDNSYSWPQPQVSRSVSAPLPISP